ncbi:hypothetical protein IMG5_118840 [Ichthyophthirius multifiliis]|uniref:Transmembrane protein n=1 Tax=Ichthyophthirius multifiliis TaxID=5932 RepID=G0QUR3_ICHMU|nr:hypothetical protein IMG5_118840 [Ichthyophthirius multifiliis]EGR31048.1 hypothetical protein IMG5_118840 [Ichthyophthirius multifiliis]|eukprot:XP_004034534.1 hypothetical protein IMG5_118840 [Ichthyophthirius multifiliis]
MKEKWFSHKDTLVHKIKNLSQKNLKISTYESLQYYFYPIFHQIQVIDSLSGRNILKDNPNLLKVDHFVNQSFLFSLQTTLQPLQEIQIIIPLIKMMKSFENYNHDPQRGHDIIAVPVFFQTEDGFKDFETAPNVICQLPEPDFSMPFNIITFTCVLMGYLFLQVYSFSTEKLSFEQKNDNVFKKIINIFRNN